MTLPVPQNISVPFAQGIDTKTDAFQLQPGQLLELENAQFTKTGKLVKRFGYDTLGKHVEGDGRDIQQAVGLAAFNNELVLFDGTDAYAYLPSTGNWINRGTAVSISASDTFIVRNSSQQLNPDVATLGGINAYAWEDSRGGVRCSVLDASTDTFVLADAVVNGSSVAGQPKLLAFNGFIVVLYTNGIGLFYRLISPLNPTILQPEVQLHSDGQALGNCPFDACVIGNRLYVAYLNTAHQLRAYSVGTNWNVSGQTTVSSTSDVYLNGFSQCLNVTGDTLGNVWINASNGTGVKTFVYSPVLLSQLTSHQVMSGTAQVETITGLVQGGTQTLFWESQPTAANVGPGQINELTYVAQVPLSGSASSQVFLRSVGLASKAFQSDGTVLVNVAYAGAPPPTAGTPQPLQQTYFTVTADGDIIAKVLPGTGGGLRTNSTLSEVPQASPTTFVWANCVKGQTIASAGKLFSLLGVNSTLLDFDPAGQFVTTVQSNNLFVAGGVLQSYDGSSFTEHGFHVYPEGITVTQVAGSLSAGTYSWFVTYEWTDNLGQVQVSEPSVALTETFSGPGGGVSLQVPTLRLTAKQGNRAAPRVVVYRTQANQTVAYQVSSVVLPTLNDPTVDWVTIVDTLSDASIIANAQLYTGGNVLGNDAPPSNSFLTTYKNRVFVGGLEDANLVWYSKNKYDNANASTIPAEFSSFLTIGVDQHGGPITAMAVMDNQLYVFKQGSVYFIAGNGPDDTGSNSDYGDPQLLTTDVGCTNPASMVMTPLGLMFMSAKGIYLLDRSLVPSYKGAPVEAYNSQTITGATLYAAQNVVVFVCSDGPALVYDYVHDQWSVWTNHEAVGSCIFQKSALQGSFAFAKGDGTVYVQDTTKFTDGTAPVLMKWTTGWLSFAGLQGYQCVWNCYVLGTFQSPHSLDIQVGYDFNPLYSQSATINATQVIGPTTWGSDATWGASSPWGGSFVPYQFRIDLTNILCTSVRISGTDSQSGSYGEGYSISGLLFEAGVIPGGNRLPATSVFGAR